jgi:hypothetical protein
MQVKIRPADAAIYIHSLGFTMAETKQNSPSVDHSRINANDDYAVRYWSEKFRCSEAELRAAVSRVGVSADAVEQYLNL